MTTYAIDGEACSMQPCPLRHCHDHQKSKSAANSANTASEWPPAERKAIAALKRLAKQWPASLRIVAAGSSRFARVCRAADVDAADEDLPTVRGEHIENLRIDGHA